MTAGNALTVTPILTFPLDGGRELRGEREFSLLGMDSV